MKDCAVKEIVSDGKTRLRPKSEVPIHQIRTLTKEMKNLLDPSYKRLRYLRYADDWIIGIIGSKDFAETIHYQIKEFIFERLKMTRTLEKIHISDLGLEGADFLGFKIKCGQAGTYSSKDLFRGWVGNVPMDKIIKRLSEKNFCTSKGTGLKKKGWIVYDDEVIISRYNSMLDRLRNSYAPADNLGTSMNRINYILKYSCAHTLAAKHRTRISTQLGRKDSKSIKALLNNVGVRR